MTVAMAAAVTVSNFMVCVCVCFFFQDMFLMKKEKSMDDGR
jgi:hypothetical protein